MKEIFSRQRKKSQNSRVVASFKDIVAFKFFLSVN